MSYLEPSAGSRKIAAAFRDQYVAFIEQEFTPDEALALTVATLQVQAKSISDGWEADESA